MSSHMELERFCISTAVPAKCWQSTIRVKTRKSPIHNRCQSIEWLSLRSNTKYSYLWNAPARLPCLAADPCEKRENTYDDCPLNISVTLRARRLVLSYNWSKKMDCVVVIMRVGTHLSKLKSMVCYQPVQTSVSDDSNSHIRKDCLDHRMPSG